MLSDTRALLGFVVLATTSLGQVLTINCFIPVAGQLFDCSSFVPAFCASIGNSTVAAGDTISRCFTGAPAPVGNECDLTLKNVLTTPAVPNILNCESALFAVAAECPPGGSGIFSGSNIRFWIDANPGECSGPEVD
ncbi:hypothetical protein B0H14DRAFT_2864209 [Mycena olivaceomarginata]|nr:hypothetical protein B0H14DRAFT_2864209 [Mycena olivaceomarginata]